MHVADTPVATADSYVLPTSDWSIKFTAIKPSRFGSQLNGRLELAHRGITVGLSSNVHKSPVWRSHRTSTMNSYGSLLLIPCFATAAGNGQLPSSSQMMRLTGNNYSGQKADRAP
jgi:hypothetical protein